MAKWTSDAGASPATKRRAVRLLALGLCSAAASSASAEPYRLRADALGQARTPTGVLMLEGDVEPTDWVTAEALIWGGSGELGDEADALVARVTLRDPEHRGELHLGRMIVGPGAIRPVHMDGVSGVGRLPWHMQVEAFGGFATRPRFESPEYSWLTGGRLSQTIPGWATVGVAYLQRRDDGRLSDHEVGADVALTPIDGLDLAARAAWDMQSPGVSEALASVGYYVTRDLRVEVYGSHRSPSRILPATSLFSVLGDVPSQLVSGRVRWRAAPRLDLIAEGGARTFEGTVGENVRLRGLLRLDDFGRSVVALQVQRLGGPNDAAWSGARGILRLGLGEDWRVSTELELVRPDDPAERGEWWPWGLVAVSWFPAQRWEVAAALEGSVTSELEGSLDGLLRVAWLWGGP